MKRLTIFVISIAALWSLVWCGGAILVKSGVHTWLKQQTEQGWVTEYSDLRVRGFPNRLDVTLMDIRLADPQTRMVWQAPFLQSHALIYNPFHHILTFPDTQSLSGKNHVWNIQSDGLQASVIADATGRLKRLKAKAAALNIQGTALGVSFANLNVGLLEDENKISTYRLVATSDAVSDAETETVLDQVQLDAELTLDRPLRAIVIEGPRPQPTSLEIKLAEYHSDGLEVKITGDLDIDNAGRISGDLTLRAVNWREMLRQAVASGLVPETFAPSLERGLNFVASLSGNTQTLDLPLSFKDGKVLLGIFPLGDAPRIRF